MALSDEQFIEQFENLTLNPEHFDHKGHLRLAWLYLSRFDLDTALKKTCEGIKAYAESLGAKDKFHWTITDGLVRIMALRITPNRQWQQFLNDNTDLVDDAFSLLLKHYSQALLNSIEAKQAALPPDIQPIG